MSTGTGEDLRRLLRFAGDMTGYERATLIVAIVGFVVNGQRFLAHPEAGGWAEATVVCAAWATWVITAAAYRRELFCAADCARRAADFARIAAKAIKFLGGCDNQATNILLGLEVTCGRAVNSTRPPVMGRTIEN